MQINRKLRMGMFGGGNRGFIGSVHRCAARMDGLIELVCGCFSSDPDNSRQSGHEYMLPDDRIYTSYEEMIEREKKLPEDQRMDFVAIVTPNHLHYGPAMMALDNGFHVVIEKPMTFSLEEARSLLKKVEETGLELALTHTYSGYPAVKDARARVARGELGRLRRIYVEYTQGWLSERIEVLGGNNAGWRTDPHRSGVAGCVGDIGTHAWHLSEYISGLNVTELCCDLRTCVDGRLLDDDSAALLRYTGGVSGVLTATQIAVGEANKLRIRLYGEKGGLEWHQQEPNLLILRHADRPNELVYTGGNGFMGKEAKWNMRTPAGHPEGYIEAFANIYRNFALTVLARMNGHEPEPEALDFPTVYDGVRGMEFIQTMVAAGNDNEHKWQKWII